MFFATIFESLVNKSQLLKTVRFPTELCDKVWVTVYFFKYSVHFCGISVMEWERSKLFHALNYYFLIME
jgi:hypothetical protein